MTEVNLNETVNGYRGSIGRLVFRNYKGRTIVGRKPVITKPPTAAQIHQREQFKEAVAHGKSAMADPALRAFYAPIALQKGISIYALAVQDFLSKPVFKPLDLSNYKGEIGDVIKITATDDLGLAALTVKIDAQDGTPIESGSAVEVGTGSGIWAYTATKQVALGTDVFIELRGVDHAGNKALLTENPTVGMDQ